MRILLTGATGFIGKDLTVRLLERGHELTVVTRNGERVDALHRKRIRIVEADICDAAAMESTATKIDGVDVLIHAAACLNYYGNRRHLEQVNVRGTRNVLEAFGRSPRMKKIIFLSSVEAMGPVAEADVPGDETAGCHPVSPYGVTKRRAENVVVQFGQSLCIPGVIFRLGNVYGPGGSAFIESIAAALREGPQSALRRYLPVYRDRFIHPVYISDASRGILRAVDEPAAEGIFHLAGPEYLRAGELFNRVAEGMGAKFPAGECVSFSRLALRLRNWLRKLTNRADWLSYVTASRGSRVHRAYSTARIRNELGYIPEVAMEEGITNTLSWTGKTARIGAKH